jgi:hypothetical protein
MNNEMYSVEEERIEDVPVSPVLRRVHGSQIEEQDEEAIEWNEVQRLLFERDWGPILAIPAQDDEGWLPRNTEEDAFDTYDFERQYGDGRAKRRKYAISRAFQEHRERVWMFEMIFDRIPNLGKYQVMKLLKQGVISKDHCTGEMREAVRWYLRAEDALEKAVAISRKPRPEPEGDPV